MERIHTKIVCTMGTIPERDSIQWFAGLIKCGMNVARLNMSHSLHFRDEKIYIPGKTYKTDARRVKYLREASHKAAIPIAILADLMGPKIRIGDFAQGQAHIEKNSEFTLHNRIGKKGDSAGVYINNFDELAKAYKPNSMFLFSDGLIRMKVKKCNPKNGVICLKVIDTGILRSRQGVVVKGMEPAIEFLTSKDREDLKFLLDMDVDYIAISYVRTADDIRKIKRIIAKKADDEHRPSLIAKIETSEALRNLHEIMDESDAIMVARGDLGMRLNVADVPILQKEIIHLCNYLGKPVITATQMLESMIDRPFPTRAEATDVANAIFDGSDAVMLSGETAIGNYPEECVCTIREIAHRAEKSRRTEIKADFHKREWRKRIEEGITYLKEHKLYPKTSERAIGDAITFAAAEIAEDLDLKAIITPTSSGETARLMARFRPGIPIIAAVDNQSVEKKLLLSYAVFPMKVKTMKNAENLLNEIVKKSISAGLLRKGDLFLATLGFPLGKPGSTNLLKVLRA